MLGHQGIILLATVPSWRTDYSVKRAESQRRETRRHINISQPPCLRDADADAASKLINHLSQRRLVLVESMKHSNDQKLASSLGAGRRRPRTYSEITMLMKTLQFKRFWGGSVSPVSRRGFWSSLGHWLTRLPVLALAASDAPLCSCPS